jgi:tRNA dimethylallyltransferase
MHFHEPSKPLIVVVGPTAVGKSAFAVNLAKQIQGEIVSCDSRLFYRGMDIGTAKPSLQERQQVFHHLIDVADPDQTWSLAVFQREAHRTIAEIFSREHFPLLVGGTGQYIRAVIQHWVLPPQAPSDRMRIVLQQWSEKIGKLGLHERLRTLDPEAASVIDATNSRRTIRALEVIFLSGRKFSDQRIKGTIPYSLFQIGLTMPRPELYRRIDERIEKMFAEGLIDEVKGLLEKGYPPTLPAFSAIGYRQVIQYLAGEMNLEETIAHIKKATHQFVRRQANWFKLNDPDIHWYDVSMDPIKKVIADMNREVHWTRQQDIK